LLGRVPDSVYEGLGRQEGIKKSRNPGVTRFQIWINAYTPGKRGVRLAPG